MQKINKNISDGYILPVHFFRDDIQLIENILKNDLTGENYKIKFDDFESNNLSSIPTDYPCTNNISFSISKPYLSLEINNRSFIHFYLSDNTTIVAGALQKINEVILQTKDKIEFTLRKITVICSIIIGIISIMLIINIILDYIFSNSSQIIDIFHPSKIIKIVVILLPILCFYSYYRMSLYSRSIIEFSWKKDKKTWWKRNKDQVILIIIGSFLGSIVTTILTSLITK